MPCTFHHELQEPHPSAWDVFDANHVLHQRIRVTMDQVCEGHAISYAQFRMLRMLYDTPNLHLGDMARRLRVTKQASSGVLYRLDVAGLVRATEGYEAEQATPFRITELGRFRLERMMGLATDRLATLDERLPGHERRRLVDLLLTADRALEPPRRPLWWLQ